MTNADLNHDLTSAIINRDTSLLSELLLQASQNNTREWVHAYLCSAVLARLPDKDNEWFWRSSLSRGDYHQLLDKVYKTTIVLLLKHGKLPGTHFSSRKLASGKRLLLVDRETFNFLLDYLPGERHSALKLVVKVPKQQPTTS